MEIQIKHIRILVALTCLTLMSASHAVPTFYTDFGTFDAASTTTLVEDFNGPGLTYNTALPSFSNNGITYTGLAGAPFPNVYLASGIVNAAGGSTILAANGQEDFRLDFDTAISAIGLDTYDNDLGGILIQIFDTGGGLLGSVIQDHAENEVGFLGIVSDVAIGSLRWTATGGQIVNSGIDNIRLGTAGSASIPEPSTLALLMLGLTAIGFKRQHP